ncbi:MAG: PSD1 domain-containing protein [Acidobacteria bacterium]|nr:PSD1 domain-containing protein [Acidobacteriota bacterium]
MIPRSVLVITALGMLPAGALAEVDFATQIHPIMLARCVSCHAGDKAQGGLALNTRAEILRGGSSGPSVLPGNSKGSRLIRRVRGETLPLMPLGRDAMPAAEIDLLAKWIDEGAKGPGGPAAARWEPPLLPRKPAVPAGAKHPVDAFLKTTGQPVSDALFARRAYLDVWGLLPTPEQLRAFEADKPAGKRARLIDALLANKENYTGHWITFWNDVLRNDDGVVYYGERKSMTPWLKKALAENKPYNRFVSELLNPGKEKDAPEGFILGVTWRGEVPAAERPPLQAAQNSAQAFLGINLKCNSCHDSFISKWKLKDAYGLASFFSPEPLKIVRCDVDTGEVSSPKFLFPELGKVSETALSLQERRAEAARFFTMKENGRLYRTIVNRYWKKLFGRGLVEPVDDMAAEPFHADLLDWLASDFADHGYDLKYLQRLLMTSNAYQLPALNTEVDPKERYTFRGPHKRRLTAEEFVDALASITGEWRMKVPNQPTVKARFVREWELKSTALTRAMGRPQRDQVTTERLTLPTTLQALELVNGATLADWLLEGARRLVENPPAPAQNLFDSGLVRRNAVKVDMPLQGAKKLWFLVENIDSYDPSRVVPMWRDAVLLKNGVETKLQDLLKNVDLERLKLPARFTVELDGSFDRLRGAADVAKVSKESDIGPAIRFFIFDREPDKRRLVRSDPRTPVVRPAGEWTPQSLVTRVYRHALQREPSEAERLVAAEVLGERLTVDGVEDFLWMVLQSPEFQYIW